MAGNDHLFAALDNADKLSETVFGFRCTYIHPPILAIIYSYSKIRIIAPRPAYRSQQALESL
jgi:hypothetical protein